MFWLFLGLTYSVVTSFGEFKLFRQTDIGRRSTSTLLLSTMTSLVVIAAVLAVLGLSPSTIFMTLIGVAAGDVFIEVIMHRNRNRKVQ